MEVKIESTKENKLLNRKEIEAYVHFDGATPSRKEIKESISGKIGANPDLVVLCSVVNEFGVKRVRVSVHAYENEETLKKTEAEYMLKREGLVVGEAVKPAEEVFKVEERIAQKALESSVEEFLEHLDKMDTELVAVDVEAAIKLINNMDISEEVREKAVDILRSV